MAYTTQKIGLSGTRSSVFGHWTKRGIQNLRAVWQRRQLAKAMSAMSERELRDLGMIAQDLAALDHGFDPDQGAEAIEAARHQRAGNW